MRVKSYGSSALGRSTGKEAVEYITEEVDVRNKCRGTLTTRGASGAWIGSAKERPTFESAKT